MNLLVVIFAFTAALAFSQERSLEAQVEVTRSTIKRITLDVSNQSRGASLNVPDFNRWEEEFKDEVEGRLIEFEGKFSRDVIGALEKLTQKYQAIYEDESILDEQKTMLLKSLSQSFEVISKQTQEKYDEIITELYDFSEYFPTSYDFISKSDKTVTLAPIFKHQTLRDKEVHFEIKKYRLKECRDSVANVFVKPGAPDTWKIIETPPNQKNCDDSLQITKNIEAYKTAIINQFGDFDTVFAKIIEGCETKACIVLKMATLSHYINLINSELNKGFNIVLNEGTRGQKVLSFSGKSIHTDILYEKVLKRSDFSDYVNQLPFDKN